MEENTNLLDFVRGLLQDEFLNKAFLLSMVTGGIAMVVMYGKQAFNFIYERVRRLIVFSVRIEQNDELFWQLEIWLFKNYQKKYRNVIAYLEKGAFTFPGLEGSHPEPDVPASNESKGKVKKRFIKYRQESDTLVIKYRGAFIKIYKGRDKMEIIKDISSIFFDSFSLSTIFGARKIKKLLEEVVAYNESLLKEEEQYFIYLFNSWDWLRANMIVSKSVNNVVIDKNLKTSFLRDVNLFLANKSWYDKRGIAYKRGYLFYGPPGNGKTSLSLSLARHLKRDIYVMNISDVSEDKALIRAYADLKKDSLLLIEDIDVMFKTKRKMESNRVSFSTLLNCMDGAFFKEGVITILTTNHRDKLDTALIRAGRVDMELHFPNPDEELIKEYINKFYETDIPINGELKGKDYSMAEVQNICLASSAETIKQSLTENV